jgi:D-serine deaminase-like pyridoxal phosphate-dependent protein
VTTSFFETQVQEELIEDGHPVLLVSGGGIARILIAAQLGGRGTAGRLTAWLRRFQTP